jgi:hypothetical protein
VPQRNATVPCSNEDIGALRELPTLDAFRPYLADFSGCWRGPQRGMGDGGDRWFCAVPCGIDFSNQGSHRFVLNTVMSIC